MLHMEERHDYIIDSVEKEKKGEKTGLRLWFGGKGKKKKNKGSGSLPTSLTKCSRTHIKHRKPKAV